MERTEKCFFSCWETQSGLYSTRRGGAANPPAGDHPTNCRNRPKHQIRIVNVAHAGDGNVHPVLLFDERNREEVSRVLAAGRELLEACIECGECVERCPFDVDIIAKMREAVNIFGTSAA